MENAKKIEGRRLVLIRMVSITMIIACINYMYVGYSTGVIEVPISRRNSLTMTGGDLWLGYLFLILMILMFIVLLFINNHQAKIFRRIAAIIGVTWILTIGICIFTSVRTLAFGI